MTSEIIQIEKIEDLCQIIKEHPKVVVEFYAEWCGPCRRIAATVKNLNNEYSSSVKFVKIEMSDHDEFGRREKIDAFPTFKLYFCGKEWNKVIGANGDKLKECVNKLLTEIIKEEEQAVFKTNF